MGMGIGGIQSLTSQMGGQSAFGNPYVSSALGGMARPATTQGSYEDYISRPTQEVKMSREAFEAQQPIATPPQQLGGQSASGNPDLVKVGYDYRTGNEQPIANSPQQLGALNPTSSLMRQLTTAYPAAPSSSNSLNSMPNAGSFSGASLYGGGSAGAGGSGGPFPLEGKYGIIKMANGGLASAAQNMAGRGRDGDSMLVHMSPGEVKGLQALAMAHGGSLSINPDTGLVEASFLKRILPMIAGAGLMMIPGVGPLAAAGMVGGFETMRTGDIGKGLMAGLGAYGGAGLTQGLTAAGTQAAGTAATEATMAANPTLTGGEIAREMGTAGFNAPTFAAGADPSTMTMMDKVGAGFKAGPSAIYNAAPTGTMLGLGSTAVSALTPEAPSIPGEPEEDPRYAGAPYRYSLSPDFSGYVPRQPQPYYRPTGLGYAEGGDIMMAQGGAYDDEPMGDNPGMAAGGIAGYAAGGLKMKTMSLGEGMYRDTDTDTASLGAYDAAKKRMEKQFAAANLKSREMPKSGIAKLGQMKAMAEGGSLGGYSDGGRMLKGPGDGMSDDIPAMIGKKQPARLADGEFVVPADVVSHLGNGSTDAGAKKLYSMMDNIRKARTGKKKQAPAVKGDKYLPKFAEGGDVATATSNVSNTNAPVFSYPGSGMSLADISDLGRLVSRGMRTQTAAPTYTISPLSNAGLNEKLTAASLNRPTAAPIMLPVQPEKTRSPSRFSDLFYGVLGGIDRVLENK